MVIAICDDEIENVNIIRTLLEEYFSSKNETCPTIKTFLSSASLIEYQEKIDLLFLDIEMPRYNGIYVGNYYANIDSPPLIIVITAYMSYLDDAMKFSVYRYISKPIDKKRLFKNVDEAIESIKSRHQSIIVETKNGVFKVNTDDIILIESKKRKCFLYLKNEVLETVIKIEQWNTLLDDNKFFRTHKSYIVNLMYVRFFDHVHVKLNECDVCVYLTYRKYSGFKKAFLRYIERN